MEVVVEELKKQRRAAPGRKIYVATDGGADGQGFAQKGAFAVVISEASVSGIQPGHDQSAPATEQWAALQAVWAVRSPEWPRAPTPSRSTSSSST